MAVKIRLVRLGKIRTPHYRIVVADSRKARNGLKIEEIGRYSPASDPSLIEVNSDRALARLLGSRESGEKLLV